MLREVRGSEVAFDFQFTGSGRLSTRKFKIVNSHSIGDLVVFLSPMVGHGLYDVGRSE